MFAIVWVKTMVPGTKDMLFEELHKGIATGYTQKQDVVQTPYVETYNLQMVGLGGCTGRQYCLSECPDDELVMRRNEDIASPHRVRAVAIET